MMCCKHVGEIKQDLTGMKKNLICKVLIERLTLKNLKTFYLFFKTVFISIFQTFSRSRKLLGKFQDFFKNSRLCMNPYNILIGMGLNATVS